MLVGSNIGILGAINDGTLGGTTDGISEKKVLQQSFQESWRNARKYQWKNNGNKNLKGIRKGMLREIEGNNSVEKCKKVRDQWMNIGWNRGRNPGRIIYHSLEEIPGRILIGILENVSGEILAWNSSDF